MRSAVTLRRVGRGAEAGARGAAPLPWSNASLLERAGGVLDRRDRRHGRRNTERWVLRGDRRAYTPTGSPDAPGWAAAQDGATTLPFTRLGEGVEGVEGWEALRSEEGRVVVGGVEGCGMDEVGARGGLRSAV